MILKRDIIGCASKIVYGRAGDQIQLLAIRGDMFLVRNKAGVTFHVRCADACATGYVKKK
jgi:hypothetical protein